MKQKTKKIIILVTSIIAMLISIIFAYCYTKGIINVEELQIEGIEMPQISAKAQTIFFSIIAGINLICAILSIKVQKFKILLIVLNAIQALLGSIINMIVAGINITILCIKTKDLQETEGIQETKQMQEKNKHEMPILEEIKQKPKWVYILIWSSIFILAYTPLLNCFSEKINPFILLLIIILVYILQIAGSIITMTSELKRDFKPFIKNFKTYMSYIVPRVGIFVVVYFIVSFVLMLVVGNASTNQQTLNEMPLWLTSVLAICFAPLIEELLFRGMLKKIVGNNKLYIVLSSLIFGLLHVMFIEENLLNYLYIIPYAMLGFLLAKIYSKTDNIYTNIFVHCMWNVFAVLMMVITQI